MLMPRKSLMMRAHMHDYWRGNQELLTEYNDNHEVKMEPSPGSFYNLPILKAQYDEILKKIETLHGQEITIRDLGPIYVGNNLKTQLRYLKVTLQELRTYAQVIKRTLEEMGAHVVN
ncbi:hypothetical protein BASA83_007085 [Batrachochytrium salamandrivorans]|nr:hypothetical protein BASA83_007085 [Batrachochytrium salamandrivorans]